MVPTITIYTKFIPSCNCYLRRVFGVIRHVERSLQVELRSKRRDVGIEKNLTPLPAPAAPISRCRVVRQRVSITAVRDPTFLGMCGHACERASELVVPTSSCKCEYARVSMCITLGITAHQRHGVTAHPFTQPRLLISSAYRAYLRARVCIRVSTVRMLNDRPIRKIKH